MAIFGLSDISFNKNKSPRPDGPLGGLVDSEFQQSTYRYPLDIGNTDKSHYMVIYIREQKVTQFGGKRAFGGDSNEFQASGVARQANENAAIFGSMDAAASRVQNIANNFGSEILGKINSGLGQINSATNGALSGITSAISKTAGSAVSGLNNLFGEAKQIIGGSQGETSTIIDTSIKKITGGSLSLLKTTFLTTDAIALYMPDTLNYSYTQGYDDMSIGGEALGKVAAAAQSASDEYKTEGGAAGFASLQKSAGLVAGSVGAKVLGKLSNSGASAKIGFTAVTGKVENPMLEMLYKSPSFRNFNFEFTFYPRDEKEALEVQRIIERLRFHQAPELVKDAQGFLVPPSEFDIKFYYAGSENPNIPPIATCVLKQMDVNYAPNGFFAYEVPNENNAALGRTGMPVSIQLLLNFTETTYLTKNDFKNSRAQTLANKV